MDFFPPFAEIRNRWMKRLLNSIDIGAAESHVFSQSHWPSGTVQIKHSFIAVSDNMHVCWSMVVRIDNNAKITDPQNCWH